MMDAGVPNYYEVLRSEEESSEEESRDGCSVGSEDESSTARLATRVRYSHAEYMGLSAQEQVRSMLDMLQRNEPLEYWRCTLYIGKDMWQPVLESFDVFCRALQSYSFLPCLTLSIDESTALESKHFSQLGKAVSKSERLGKLIIVVDRKQGVSTTRVNASLDSVRHKSLRGFDFRSLINCLRSHPYLEEIVLRGILPEEIRALAPVLPSLPSLAEVQVSMFHVEKAEPREYLPLDDDTVSSLLSVDTLRELRLFDCKISEASYCALVGASLASLKLYSCKFPAGSGAPVAASLGGNTSLKELVVFCSPPELTFFSALKKCLASNRSLTKLVVDVSTAPHQCTQELIMAVKHNYTLEHIECWSKYFIKVPMLSILTHLNKAGRRYLLEDPTSKAKGFQVLDKVRYNTGIDCLFLHLRENPLLCDVPRHATAGRKKASQLK